MQKALLPCLIPAVLYSILLPAQGFEELNNQANTEYSNKNYRKAVELCTQAINLKINTRSFLIRGDSYYSLSDYTAALSDYQSALTHYNEYYGSDNRERGSTYYWLARCKQQLKKYEEAISDFGNALYYNYKDEGYVYWNRGACYYSTGKYGEADADYQVAAGKISDSKSLSRLYLDRGECQNKLKKYESANTMFTTALSYNADNYLAYWNRGYNKYWDLKYTETLSDYSSAIRILTTASFSDKKADLIKLYKAKSSIHQLLKQYDEALDCIGKCIEADPNKPDNYSTRAGVYISMKQTGKARSDYETAVLLETENKRKADIYLNRSMMYWDILDFRSCLADLNKAVELDPADGMNFWHRSMLYGYKKNYPMAIKDCNTALELYRKDSFSTPSLLWLRAEHKSKSGDYTGAKEDFQAYLTYYPDSYNAYYELGRLFKNQLMNNDLAQANLAKAAEMALGKKDTSKYCYIRFFQGKKEESFAFMSDLIQHAAGKEYSLKWNLHNMACLYSLAGDVKKGLDFLEESMSAGFDDYRHLVNDRDLVLLMKQPQWKSILTKYKVPAVIQ